MRITKLFTIGLLSGALFSSCNDDVREAGLVNTGEVAYASISLYDSQTVKSVTQGADDQGTATERKIESLEFYVFNSDGNRDSNESNDGYVNIASIEANHQYTFAVSAGNGKKILVAANLSLGELPGATLEEVTKEILDTQIQSPVAAGQLIPMAGEAAFSVSAGSVENVPIAVSRLYTKFSAPTAASATVEITVNTDEYEKLQTIFDENGQALQGSPLFELSGFVVVNGLKKSFVFPHYGALETEQWDEDVWTIGNDVQNYTASVYQNNQLGTVYSGDSFLTEGAVYVYENAPVRSTFSGITGFNPSTVYALIIEADFVDSADLTNRVTRYWRINVNKTGERESIYKILRNAIYNVDITEVHTVGYGTPGEAEIVDPIIPDVDEAGIKAIISTAAWRVFNESTTI